MQGQEGTHNLVFLENDVVEATFPDDKSDIEDEPDQQYEVNYWRKEEDIPTGFTFKSKKKIFVKAVDNIKITLKKGVQFEIDDLIIEILDRRNGQNGVEIDIEIIDKKDRGQAVLKVFGPNSRKECTLMINKSKKHEAKFVKILAVCIIKRLLDSFISGQSWNNFFKKKGSMAFKKPKSCESCSKGFLNDMTLNRHIKQYHVENKVCCDMCEEKFYTERSLNKHKKGHHTMNTSNSKLHEKEVVVKSKFKEHESVHQVSVTCENIDGDHMQRKFMCDLCKNVFYDEIALKNHTSASHAKLLLEKEDQTEEMEIEDVIADENYTSGSVENNHIKHESMDVDVDVGKAEDETLKRSNLQDSKVLEKEKKREEDERKYEQQKKEIEQRKFDEEKVKVTEKIRDKKRKKKLSVKQAKKSQKIQKYPANITEIPENLKALVNEGDLQLVAVSDGACAANSAAGHLFFDPNSGPELRGNMNKHMAEHWYFYKNKVSFPYVRSVGVKGERVLFKEGEEEKFIQFLRTDKARFLWCDCEDLQIIANLYQVKIKVIKTDGDDDLNPIVLWIFPAEEMKTSKLIPEGQVSDMVLINYSDRHYNLVIPKDHEIAKYGVLSEREVYVHKKEVKQTEDHKDCKETIENLKKHVVSLETELREERAKREEIEKRVITPKETDDKHEGPDVEVLEEIMLTNSKAKGYIRDGPQFEARLKQDIKLYKCNECNSTFEDQKILNSHIAKHRKTESFECDLCGVYFKRKNLLQDHVIAKHKGNNSNKTQDYNSSQSRVSKQKSLDTNKQVTCDCARSFTTKSELSKHMATHTNVQYDCNKYTKKFETIHDLTNHTSIHTDEQLSCKSCGEDFRTQSKFTKHIETHTQDGDWNCDECSYQTNSHKDLDRHKAYHGKPKDDNNLGSKNCNFCTQKFNTNNELQEHKQRHKTFKPCRNIPDCEFGINCLYNHNNYDKNKSLCYECGNEFNTFNELMFHRKSKHTMRACKNFMQNRCRFSGERCWFNHNNSIDQHQTKQHEKISSPQPSKKSLISEPSVFQNIPVNLAPPSTAPTEATWRKMITMMEYLNQMMQTMKKTNPFLSL